MKRISQCFTSDYRDDTMIEYVETGSYSMLNCSYTSEDPDCGTDTIHFSLGYVASIERLAFEMLQEITDYLDFRNVCEKTRGQGGEWQWRYKDLEDAYGAYSSCTLIAFEHALTEIVHGYVPTKWYMDITEASEMIAKALEEEPDAVFSFTESDTEEAKGNPDKHGDDGPWFGIRRIRSLFDNGDDEFIVAVGQWGGGAVAVKYDDFEANNRAEIVKKAITESTDWDADNYIFVEKEEKGEK